MRGRERDMEQLELFSSAEALKRNIERTLVGGEFYRCRAYCGELALVEPDHELLRLALDITGFWTLQYGHDGQYREEGHVTAYRRWRSFEEYVMSKSYRLNPIIPRMKEEVFLTWIGLETVTPELRSVFDQEGISVLSLLVEIEDWPLAQREIGDLLRAKSCRRNDSFFLTCSKVYYRSGYLSQSRASLLRAFWARPDRIGLTDVEDTEILDALSDIDTFGEHDDDAVELIPYAGLMKGIFAMPRDGGGFQERLRKRIGLCETEHHGVADTRLALRLFSLYAWWAESARRIGSDYIEARRRMKLVNEDLFCHYRDQLIGRRAPAGRPSRERHCFPVG
jgi:hypothetical protein